MVDPVIKLFGSKEISSLFYRIEIWGSGEHLRESIQNYYVRQILVLLKCSLVALMRAEPGLTLASSLIGRKI